MQWLQRHQALCYIQSIPSKQDLYAEPTAFESLLLQEEPLSHSISILYSILLLSIHPDPPPPVHVEVGERTPREYSFTRLAKKFYFDS